MIKLLKQKHDILEGILPANLIKHKSDGEYTVIDKPAVARTAITNLFDSVFSNQGVLLCVYIEEHARDIIWIFWTRGWAT